MSDDGAALKGEVLADWSIPRHVDHVSEARRHVHKLAETVLGYGNRAHDVGVCASETISNAVIHGKGEDVRIFVCADEEGISVEVTDDGSGAVPSEPSNAAESGRGIRIVAALADRWGYVLDEDTGELHVYFDFDIEPSPMSGDAR